MTFPMICTVILGLIIFGGYIFLAISNSRRERQLEQLAQSAQRARISEFQEQIGKLESESTRETQGYIDARAKFKKMDSDLAKLALVPPTDGNKPGA